MAINAARAVISLSYLHYFYLGFMIHHSSQPALGPHRYNWSSVAIRPGSMPPTSPTNDRLLNHDADTGPTKQLHVTSMQPLRVLGTQNAGTRCALDKDEPAAHFVLDCLASLSRP